MIAVAAAESDEFGYADPPQADPVRPVRWRPDPILTAQIIYEGMTLYQAQRGEEPTLSQVIWFLLEEAVKVDRSIVRPAPSVQVTMGIEYYHTGAEITGAYNQVLAEIRQAELAERSPEPFFASAERQRPNATAHRRYLEVMGWLRAIRAKSRVGWTRRAGLILALAGGMPPRKAVDAFPEEHFGNRKAVTAARHRALNDIAAAIRMACKSLAIAA